MPANNNIRPTGGLYDPPFNNIRSGPRGGINPADRLSMMMRRLVEKTKQQNMLRNRLEVLNRHDYITRTISHGANEFPNTKYTGFPPLDHENMRILRYPKPVAFNTDTQVKYVRLAQGIGNTVKNLGAGVAINALGNHFLMPKAEEAGTWIGTQLYKAVTDQEKGENLFPQLYDKQGPRAPLSDDPVKEQRLDDQGYR